MLNLTFPFGLRLCGGIVITFCSALLLTSCAGRAVSETSSPKPGIEKPKPPTAVPMWLGNPTRSFFGTGPMPKALKVIWEFKTSSTRGRLHPDPWGGSGWPGQPAIVGDRIYFGSADSYVYCLNKSDGTVIWKFKTTDSAKSSPCIVGDRLVIGNLDRPDLKPTLRRRLSTAAFTSVARIISTTALI